MSTDEATTEETPGTGKGGVLDPPKDIRWIMDVLPHRYPMLLVDRVLELESRRRLVAIKNVTINEEVFLGHFPDHPVVPGVLQIEGLAQAGGILQLAELEPAERARKVLYFTTIERARFRRPVVPGDQLRYEVEVTRWRGKTCRMAGRALVDGVLATEAQLSSMLIDR